MTQFVQITMQLVPKGEWDFSPQTYGTSFVWSSGKLDEQVQIFVEQCVEEAAQYIQAHVNPKWPKGQALTDEAAVDIARNCFVINVTQQPNELPNPPSVEELRLTRIAATEATVATLQKLRDGSAGTTRGALDQTIDFLQEQAARIGKGWA